MILAWYWLHNDKKLFYIKNVLYKPDIKKIVFHTYCQNDAKLFWSTFNYQNSVLWYILSNIFKTIEMQSTII